MKNLLFGILLLIVTLSSSNEHGIPAGDQGKLTGAVTYKDYFESSNQADPGCEIYAVPAADLESTRYEDISMVLDNFQRSKSGYSLSVYNTMDPVRLENARENFDAVSDLTGKYLTGFKQLPTVVRAATNGTGNYTLNLQPGKYYILVVSGSIKSDNIAESHGNIAYKTVDIKSAGETFLNFNFEKSENMLIMQISRWQPQGC